MNAAYRGVFSSFGARTYPGVRSVMVSPELMGPVVPSAREGKALSGSCGFAVLESGQETMNPAARV